MLTTGWHTTISGSKAWLMPNPFQDSPHKWVAIYSDGTARPISEQNYAMFFREKAYEASLTGS